MNLAVGNELTAQDLLLNRTPDHAEVAGEVRDQVGVGIEGHHCGAIVCAKLF